MVTSSRQTRKLVLPSQRTGSANEKPCPGNEKAGPENEKPGSWNEKAGPWNEKAGPGERETWSGEQESWSVGRETWSRGTRKLVPSTRNLVPGTRNLVPRNEKPGCGNEKPGSTERESSPFRIDSVLHCRLQASLRELNVVIRGTPHNRQTTADQSKLRLLMIVPPRAPRGRTDEPRLYDRERSTAKPASPPQKRTPPDVIILDLIMPDMTGFEVAGLLKDHPSTARVPILVLTSKEISADERRELQSKITACVQKGKSARDQLVAEIRRLRRGAFRTRALVS